MILYFQVIRHLLNQSTDRQSNQSLLINLWSFSALVITTCFCGIVVSLLVIKEVKKINTIDELVESNLKIYSNNDSWIWWQIHNNLRYNNTIDTELAKIAPGIDFIRLEDKVDLRHAIGLLNYSKFCRINLSIFPIGKQYLSRTTSQPYGDIR